MPNPIQNINRFLHSIYGRLTLLILFITALLGAILIFLSQKLSQSNQLEIMQEVNRSTAMYITEQEPLITAEGVQEQRVTELSERAMVINPSLEIYVIDSQGKILSHRMPDDSVAIKKVDMNAIHAYLLGEKLPILGDNPRRPEEPTVFSTSPIKHNGKILGYVYATIGGEIYHQLQQQGSSLTTQKLFFWTALFAVLAAAIIGGLLIFLITRPIGRLSQRMQKYRLGEKPAESIDIHSDNEISTLTSSFYELKQTINQQLEAINQLDQTRRELIANVSHDLRTPLAALQGSLELMILRKDSLTLEEQDKYIKSAFKQSKRLTRLVEDLFHLAKLESGGIELNLETFSVSELLQDCSHGFAQLASKHGVELQLKIEPTVNSIVKADIGLIERVLENLISNAIQHTPKGGTVTLCVEESEQGAKVVVADTGIGINSAELPHIFERFYQSKQTEHSSQIGSGLGLAIVKRILAIHNATIQVSSKINEGTQFEFELKQPVF